MWRSLRITSKPQTKTNFLQECLRPASFTGWLLLLKTALSSPWVPLRSLLTWAPTMSWDVKLTEMAAGCYFSSPQQWLNVLKGFLESLRQSHIQLTMWVDECVCGETVHTSHPTCCTLGGIPRWVRWPLAICICPSGFHGIPKVPRSFLLIPASLSSLPLKPHTETGKCTQKCIDTACCGLELSLIWPSSTSVGGSWRTVCGESRLCRAPCSRLSRRIFLSEG